MVNINIRDNNNLINLTIPGKTPIRGRTAPNSYFHTPLELLLSALGLCIGGIINNYCRMNDINPKIFENINVTLGSSDVNKGSFCVEIKHPRDFDHEHIVRLSDEISNCVIAKELKKELVTHWTYNETTTEELIKKTVDEPCCGSRSK